MTSSKLSELKELRLKVDDSSKKYPHKVSEADELFYKAALNNWLTLIECLELAINGLNHTHDHSEAYDGEHKITYSNCHGCVALAEIELKLGGI